MVTAADGEDATAAAHRLRLDDSSGDRGSRF
jgi:hypothetical protein